MIRASVHGLLLNEMAATHGGPDRDRRDRDKAVVGVFDDRRFTLHFAHAVDEPIALDLELLLS